MLNLSRALMACTKSAPIHAFHNALADFSVDESERRICGFAA